MGSVWFDQGRLQWVIKLIVGPWPRALGRFPTAEGLFRWLDLGALIVMRIRLVAGWVALIDHD